VEGLARRLPQQLPAGSVVMLCSGNRPQYTAAFLAVLAAGMTVFPVAPDIAGPELLSAGQRSGAAASFDKWPSVCLLGPMWSRRSSR